MRLYRPSIITFQFYDSPIKRSPEIVFIDSVQFSFNSMIVRLKALCTSPPTKTCSCFNSMIVRLKENTPQIKRSMIRRFQFYDSPIKRI